MDRFIFEVIEPLISKDLQQEKIKERTEKINTELANFIKGYLVPINKELAKKTRQLFVTSSDNESLKESVQTFEREIMKLRGEMAMKQNQIVKQRLFYERQINQLKEQITNQKAEMKKIVKKLENDIDLLNEENRDKLVTLRKQHKTQLQTKLQQERTHWEQVLQTQKDNHSQDKHQIVSENSKQRSKLIKKYQEKLYQLKNQSEETLDKTTKELTAKYEDMKNHKNDLFNKLTMEEATARRLTLQLNNEVGQHGLFKAQFESTFRELENNRKRFDQQLKKYSNQIQTLKMRLKQSQKDMSEQIKDLKLQLTTTTAQKQKKYIDTVELMTTQHRIQVQSLQNNLIEQKEIAITNVEVKAYEELMSQVKRFQRLQIEHRDLLDSYNLVKDKYQAKIKEMEETHQNQTINLQERKQYQFVLSGENAKRQYLNLKNKFSLQIKSLKAQQVVQLEAAAKKAQQQKVSLSNKLISQYENMLSDQRNNTQIQIKQKIMEFQRKAKAYQKRMAEAEKRKAQLKVVIERMKIESQMKIQSMMQVNQKLEGQIQQLHQRILQLQKAKSALINDYQFQLLLLHNEIQKIREDYKEREDQLRANLNQKIVVKNKQTAKMAQKIKQQTEELIRRNKERTTALEREYQQLKRVINQKTSLPEDIEALRVFHAAYLQKQNELINEKKKRQELQRQLNSKDAIQKVFAAKDSFKRLTAIDKINQPTKNNFITKFTSTHL